MAIGGLLFPGVTVQDRGCSPDILTLASLPFEGAGLFLNDLLTTSVLVVLLGGWTGGLVLLFFTAALLLNCSVLPGGLNGMEAFLTGPLRTLWKLNAPLQIKE